MNGRWKRSGLLVLPIVVVVVVVVVACGGGGVPSPPRGSGPQPNQQSFEVREGGRLFASFCAPCHGEAGRGDGAYLSAGAPAAPADFGADEVRGRIRRDRVAARLGLSEAAGARHCPPWGNTLSLGEIEALAGFVEGLAAVPPGSATADP